MPRPEGYRPQGHWQIWLLGLLAPDNMSPDRSVSLRVEPDHLHQPLADRVLGDSRMKAEPNESRWVAQRRPEVFLCLFSCAGTT